MDREGREPLTGEGEGTGERRPVRVHRLIARLNVGGPAMHVAHLASDMDAHGYRTRLLAGSVTSDEGDMEYYARALGVIPEEVPGLDRRLRPLAALRAFLFLLKTFRRDRPDIVHTHTAMAGALGRAAALCAQVPVIVHTYHGHVLGGAYFSSLRTLLFLTIERVLARGTRKLVVLTERQRLEMLRDLGIGREAQYRIIALGLDLDRFTRTGDREGARVAGRNACDLPEGALVVGFVGRLVPVKNLELLLKAVPKVMAHLGERGKDLRVLVAGDGEMRAELEAAAVRLGIEGQIVWLGWRRDVASLYPAMDVLVLTSHDEGTPVAVIEAMASGVPVVARSVGGVPEVLGGGEYGTLVENEDPGALGVAISNALLSPPAPARTEAATRAALSRFGRQRLADEMDAMYRELLHGTP